VNLLFVAVPYAAFACFVVGVAARFRRGATISSRSSQILESRWLVWGTVPFHIGITVLFLGHLIPLLIPDAWRVFVSHRAALVLVESAGLAAAVLCLTGLVVLFIRRIASRPVRAGSAPADLVVLGVLILQVGAGIGVATMHRWGAMWSVATIVPYLRSLVMLHPDPALVAGIPPLMLTHLAGAWIVLALLPFTRLVHMLTFPLGYLVRAPQKVVWVTRPKRGQVCDL
jgi:nitrate reductase gamma subunit